MVRVPVWCDETQGTVTPDVGHVSTHGPKGADAGKLCTLSVEPTFLGRVSELTFESADTEMARFVRHTRGFQPDLLRCIVP